MEILPSEYQNIELSRYEKMFVRHAISNDGYGFLLLKVNPTMIENESMNVLISSRGVVFFKFFEDFSDASLFGATMQPYTQFVYPTAKKIISEKLLGNKSLSENTKALKFPINIVHVFPNLKRADISKMDISAILDFVQKQCLFSEDFSELRQGFGAIIDRVLDNPIVPVSDTPLFISDLNVNSVMQRIAPEYVTVRVACVDTADSTPGVDSELLVVDEKDVVVRAFRLDKEQINIVNRISKDDPNQLILACAGSGKSVLLISKCFKAAQMNPNKKFLITCRNENLHSLYTWFIDRAGLREKNVECMTFHTLCKKLLEKNGFTAKYGDFDGWVSSVIDKLNRGQIQDRYYGIFIDEVQAFESEWYKFCYNLLENKNTKDHIFVICGDKTQRLEKLKKRGQAPWQVGDGYPNYRGGNKNIRIEKNYRNCIEINEYINRFVSNAKQYLYQIQEDYEIDPDMFLRGQAVFHGDGVKYIQLPIKKASCEIDTIVQAINKIHDENEIPYDEIAVIMYQGQYRKKIAGWLDKQYYLQQTLETRLRLEDIPCCRLYSTDAGWQDHFGETGGVRLIKFQSTLGLDFRAAIICGLVPLGEYDGIKNPNWEHLKTNEETYSNAIAATQSCIQNLYVACTRAKEVLYIIAPETENESVFMKMLKDSI